MQCNQLLHAFMMALIVFCSCGHVKVIFNTHDLPHQKIPHSCTFDFSSERIVANFTAIKLRRFYFLSIKGWNNLKFLLYVNLDLYSWFGEEPILQFKENVLRMFKLLIPIIEKTKKRIPFGCCRYLEVPAPAWFPF